jgi:hypothetical protein
MYDDGIPVAEADLKFAEKAGYPLIRPLTP